MTKRLPHTMTRFCFALGLAALAGCAEQPFLNGTEHLVVSFERSGGFAGKPVTARVDTSKLSPTDAQALRFMIQNANFFSLPARLGDAVPHPDRYQYRLTVLEKSPAYQSHEVVVEEDQVPGNMRPLVHWLMDAAKRADPAK